LTFEIDLTGGPYSWDKKVKKDLENVFFQFKNNIGGWSIAGAGSDFGRGD